MIYLNSTQYRIRNNNRPEHSAENTVDYKKHTSDKVHDPDFPEIFKNKAQHNKK